MDPSDAIEENITDENKSDNIVTPKVNNFLSVEEVDDREENVDGFINSEKLLELDHPNVEELENLSSPDPEDKTENDEGDIEVENFETEEEIKIEEKPEEPLNESKKEKKTSLLLDDTVPKKAQAVNKLFEKAIEMEEDLEVLRAQYEDIRQEKENLETRIENKDKMILDTSSKLEKAMGNMQQLRELIDKREKDLTNIQKENQMLQDLRHISSIRDERMTKVEGASKRKPKRAISADRMEKIIKLEDELKFKKKNLENLEKEVKTVKKQLKHKDEAIDDLQKEIDDRKKNEENSYQLECRNTELQYQVDTLKKEIRTLKQITRMKTKTIEQLNLQISSWQNLEESYKDIQKQLKTKQVKVRNLLYSLNNLKKENKKKQKEIVTILNSRDDLPVRCLEEDKKYLKEQITQSQKKRSEMDKTIKKQEKQIAILKRRMDAVNLALKETKVGKLIQKKGRKKRAKNIRDEDIKINFDTTNFVQKNLFLLLKKDAELLRRKKDNLMTLLEEKDSSIETLGQKIVSLQSRKKKEEKQQKIKLKGVKKRIKQLQANLKKSEMDFRKSEYKMKNRIMELKKRLIEAKENKKSDDN